MLLHFIKLQQIFIQFIESKILRWSLNNHFNGSVWHDFQFKSTSNENIRRSELGITQHVTAFTTHLNWKFHSSTWDLKSLLCKNPLDPLQGFLFNFMDEWKLFHKLHSICFYIRKEFLSCLLSYLNCRKKWKFFKYFSFDEVNVGGFGSYAIVLIILIQNTWKRDLCRCRFFTTFNRYAACVQSVIVAKRGLDLSWKVGGIEQYFGWYFKSKRTSKGWWNSPWLIH